jgi:hypothetical protein
MARGWESKSVEEQMAAALGGPPAGSNAHAGQQDRRRTDLDRAIRERRRQALNLQRENILSQRTSNPARRSALEAALAEVEAQLNKLG